MQVSALVLMALGNIAKKWDQNFQDPILLALISTYTSQDHAVKIFSKVYV